jgi:hypothetical protein
VLKVGAVCAFVAAPLAIVANAFHPRIADFSSHIHRADSAGWVAIHMAILVASLTALGFQSTLSDLLAGGRLSGPFARHAFVFAVIGNGVLAVWIAVDGLAMRQLASEVAQEHSTETAAAVLAAEKIDAALQATWFLVYWGIASLLFGLAVYSTNHFPRWLGLVAAVCGIGVVAAAFDQAFAGISVPLVVAESAFAGILTLWIVAMGWLMWRMAAVVPSAGYVP